VLWGLTALVVVALLVGMVFGGAALVGSRVLGLDSGSAEDPQATTGDSLYIPSPSPTSSPSATPTATPSATGTAKPSRPAKRITLISGQARVSSFGRIDLSGTFPGGEGAVLEVQRLEGGDWADFYSITAVVSAGAYATVVQTSRTGVNTFRMIDSDSGQTSNPVRVTVG